MVHNCVRIQPKGWWVHNLPTDAVLLQLYDTTLTYSSQLASPMVTDFILLREQQESRVSADTHPFYLAHNQVSEDTRDPQDVEGDAPRLTPLQATTVELEQLSHFMLWSGPCTIPAPG